MQRSDVWRSFYGERSSVIAEKNFEKVFKFSGICDIIILYEIYMVFRVEIRRKYEENFINIIGIIVYFSVSLHTKARSRSSQFSAENNASQRIGSVDKS